MITKKEFMRYEMVRRSGVTDMFAVSTVQRLTDLPREKVIEIMKNFHNLKVKFFVRRINHETDLG